MSLIIQIYDAANLELFLENDLNRGHLEYSHLEISHTDRFFFFFLIKRMEKEPTNLPSLLIQASKLPQMFQRTLYAWRRQHNFNDKPLDFLNNFLNNQ